MVLDAVGARRRLTGVHSLEITANLLLNTAQSATAALISIPLACVSQLPGHILGLR